MAQRLVTSFVNTNRPGAYFDVSVKSTPIGFASTGDILLIGEAEGGADFSSETLKENFFTPDQIDVAIQKYIRGDVVDALRALSAPSNDTNIQGSVGRIYVAKTNEGAKASAVSAQGSATYGTFYDKNYGIDGNKYSYQVTTITEESGPAITSSAITIDGIAEQTQVVADTFANTGDGQYFDIDAQAGNQYRVYMDTTGAMATVPAAAGRTLVQVDISGLVSAADVGDAVAAAVNALADFSAPATGTGVIVITDANEGDVADAANGDLANAWAVSTTVQGDDGDGSIFDALSFSIRVNGGAAQVITLGVGEATHDTIAELAAEIDTLLDAYGYECAEGTTANTIIISAAEDADANEKGYGKVLELIDSTPGDLAVIGLSEQIISSSAEPEIELNITREDTNTDESFNIEAEVALLISYDGAGGDATVSIDADSDTLTTKVASVVDLEIDLTQYSTVRKLAEYINSQADYSAAAVSAAAQMAPVNLDEVTDLGISHDIAISNNNHPGRVKRSAYNYLRAVTQSAALNFTLETYAGLPDDTASAVFLTGGAKGSTSGADVVNALSAAEGIDVSFVVPLFSQDATEDIAEGKTDDDSTYTIDSVNFATKSHILKMSQVKIKKHRIAFLSKWGSFQDIKDHAGDLASFRCNLFFQKSSQVDSLGVVQSFAPWHTAAVAAGMQSAGFYKSLTNKQANVISFVDPSGFDSGKPGDVETAIDAGLFFLQTEDSGSSWVVDQTTYGIDENFVYNSLQATYAADVVALNLASSMQKQFVGASLADVDAATAYGFVAKKMEEYKKLKLIVGSDDAPLGFKGLKINQNGPVMEVKIEIKLATAILFIPISIEISQVSSSAEQ